MISSLVMNNGSQTYTEKRARSPRADERSGSIRSKDTSQTTVKVRTYTVGVKDGQLVLAANPKRTVVKTK